MSFETMIQQKRAILDALADLPDEAFPNMVMALRARIRTVMDNHGFQPESTAGFDRLAFALDDFILTATGTTTERKP